MDNNWTDKDMMEFAEQYRFSSSRISLEIYKKSKEVKKEKDYEILKLRIGNTEHIVDADKSDGTAKEYHIHSVKRLSDNSTWAIGDKTNCGVITKFEINDNNCLIVSTDYSLGLVYGISALQKVKGYLFITEDNVIIYEGDYYYSVNNKFCHSGKNNGLGWYHPETGEKYFSTMDAASEYILCNKPLLSLNEVFSKCNVDYSHPDSHPLAASLKKLKILRFEELKELAKQKLK